MATVDDAQPLIAVSSVERQFSKTNVNLADFSEDAIKIKNSAWRQQRFRTTTLKFSKTKLLLVYAVLFIICIICGSIITYFSQSVTHQEFSPYSDVSECQLEGYSNSTLWGKTCTVNYTIDHDFSTPIYFYYKLTNVYQNHRRYVQSRSDPQLTGDYPAEVEDCSPIQYYNDDKMVPCGLIAYSFFNDKYNITHIDGSTGVQTQLCPYTASSCTGDERKSNWSEATWYYEGTWENDGIAWSSDKKKFGSTELRSGLTNRGELQNWQHVTLPNTDDLDLIVWMRTAASSTFTKLHRINRDLEFKKGDRLMVKIKNYFDVSEFHGSKALVISTTSVMGGQSQALGLMFFIMAGLSALAFVVFFVFIPGPDWNLLDSSDPASHMFSE